MKIALIGYGKMGKMIEETALGRGHEIVSIIDVDNQDDFGSEAFGRADVAIEFTSPTAAYDNIVKAWQRGVKVVSGSTGWMHEHEADVRRACGEGHTLLWASNFSVGVGIFRAVNRYLAAIMNQFPQYDVSMEETHHVHKLDHPSGTAITLAQDILDRIDRKTDWEVGRLTGPDGAAKGFVMGQRRDMLRIDCRREGEVPGTHTVKYGCDADVISITHEALGRKGFALGAVLAAEWTGHQTGLLTIEDYYKSVYGF